MHALTGANGAGKSTLMNLLAGVHTPSAGEILIDGIAVHFASPAEARAAGVAAVYQELARAARAHGRRERLARPRAAHPRGAARPAGAAGRHDAAARGLSPAAGSRRRRRHARRRGRASWSRSPGALSSSARILTLDEPTAVLSAEERARLFETVAELKRRGLLVLFVSHRLDEVFEIADRVTVLRNGRRVFSAATAAVTRAELVRHDGRPRCRRPDAGRAATLRSGAPLLAIRVPCRRRRRLSSGCDPGEVVGLGGLVGSGRTRLARRLAGLEAGARGRLPDRRAALHASACRAQAVARGIVYLTEDRKRDGLFAGLSVLRNASAGLACRPVEARLRRRRRRAAPGRADAPTPEGWWRRRCAPRPGP